MITRKSIRHCVFCGKPFSSRKLTSRYCSTSCGRRGVLASIDPVARFWSHVTKTDGCWLWNASTDGHGYGEFRYQGKMRRAHRFSYALAQGPIPVGLCVCHHCDNPPCVNPAHLWLGTLKDNFDDMVRKGRHRFAGRLPNPPTGLPDGE